MSSNINVDKLWVGDLLLLKKSGRIGKFLSIVSDSKIKITIGEKIILTKISNIEIAPEQKEKPLLLDQKPLIDTQIPKTLESSIDLHIDVLHPSLTNSIPERIIDYQVKAVKHFIEDSIAAKSLKIEIIHGKGEGVLKSEVLHLLSLYDEVTFTFDLNQGGATEVWFGY